MPTRFYIKMEKGKPVMYYETGKKGEPCYHNYQLHAFDAHDVSEDGSEFEIDLRKGMELAKSLVEHCSVHGMRDIGVVYVPQSVMMSVHHCIMMELERHGSKGKFWTKASDDLFVDEIVTDFLKRWRNAHSEFHSANVCSDEAAEKATRKVMQQLICCWPTSNLQPRICGKDATKILAGVPYCKEHYQQVKKLRAQR